MPFKNEGGVDMEVKRTGKKWCSCGFKCRGENHNEGTHHKMKKKEVVDLSIGKKTNVGDPRNSR